MALVLSGCAAAAPQICTDDDLRLWRVSAAQAIRAHVRYPKEAFAKKLEGTVRVDFSVDATGKLLRASTSQSSGVDLLDAAAIAAVRRATFPAPGCGGQVSSVSHIMPIVFALADDRGAPQSNRDWVDRIRAKIRSNLAIPNGTPSDIEVAFSVVQLPSGEVQNVRMLSSSGFSPYDEATERAILKSSPLPRAASPAQFVRVLELRFRP